MNKYLSKIFLAIAAVVASYFILASVFVISNTEIVSGLFTVALLSIIVLLSKQHAEKLGDECPNA